MSKTFVVWLREQKGRNDPVGDLAYDFCADSSMDFRGVKRKDQCLFLRDHLLKLNAVEVVFNTLQKAIIEWGGVHNSPPDSENWHGVRDDWDFGVSFCESVHVTGISVWHIRCLTNAGKKLGGGIDTPSLCGKVKVRAGWDLDFDVAQNCSKEHVCKECMEFYTAGQEEEECV